jgi:hypothetical protein
VLKRLGSVSSKYYLLGAPIIFASCWAAGLVYVLVAGR